MRVLVTGGAGFVGRWFTLELLRTGCDVDCVDNLVPGGGGIHPANWPLGSPLDFQKFSFFEEDARVFLQDRNEHYDLVIQLAAVVGGRLTIERDPLAVAQDLSIDASYWSWARFARPTHTIAFSSSAAYPVDLQREGATIVLSETDINFEGSLGMPDLSYGWAKLTNEYLALLAHKEYGLQSTVYRPFSGYGEDQDLNYPFASICRRAIEERGSNSFRVWGSGRQGRDFIHISDVVSNVLLTYPKIVDASPVNLSTGRLTTFLELGKMAVREAGYDAEVFGDSTMPEGVFARVGDPQLMHSLGGEIKVQIEEGVHRGVEYQARVWGLK